MLAAFRRYLDLFDQLRRVREEHANDETLRELAERVIDEELDALWESMSEQEQASTREQAWRAWPDEYAKRTAPVRDVSVWEREGTTPRAPAKAA